MYKEMLFESYGNHKNSSNEDNKESPNLIPFINSHDPELSQSERKNSSLFALSLISFSSNSWERFPNILVFSCS